MSSSNTVKYPSLPIATMGFTDKQLTDYGLEMLRLNQPVAGLRLDGLLISRGSWDTVRAVQAALLHRGVKTETCNQTGAPPPPRVDVNVTVDMINKGSDYVGFTRVGPTVTRSGGPYAGHNMPRNVDIPFSAETVTLHRKNRYPAQIPVRQLADMIDGRKQAEPQPFDLERAKAGDPIQTRDGRAVKFVSYFSLAQASQQIICTLVDNPKLGYQFRYADGRFVMSGARSVNDLVMAPVVKPKRTVWVNTYREPVLYAGVVGVMYESEEKAKGMVQIMPPGAFASVAVHKEIDE